MRTRRLKTLLLTILLALALMPKSLPAQEMDSSMSSSLSLEIESDKYYSGETVKALLDAVETVARDKIAAAFNEGYKQGLLDSYPDAAYWQSLSMYMSNTAKTSAASLGWGTVLGVSGVVGIICFAGGLLVSSCMR